MSFNIYKIVEILNETDKSSISPWKKNRLNYI